MPKPVDVLVAGHICVDFIPEINTGLSINPGTLVEVGPAKWVPGGAVCNVGTALSRLGLQAQLVAKIGDDELGAIVLKLIGANAPLAIKSLKVDANESTSYTVVLNLAGQDRMFLHSPGANQSFQSSDVTDTELESARHLHFGYPPLMKRMYEDNGFELVQLFERAKRLGLTTSLDLSLPDPNSPSGKVDWRSVLGSLLPYVDYFMPSIQELIFMLEPARYSGLSESQMTDPENVRWAAQYALELGASSTCIKLGSMGIYYRDRGSEILQNCYPVEVAGTTGSGDATIAGFLAGILEGQSVQDSMSLASTVGACSCEAVDSVSGIPFRPELERRKRQFEMLGSSHP